MVFKRLAEHADSIIARDPAARSRAMVMLTYPCFHAVLLHRLAHPLHRSGWRLLARIVSQMARFLTGIEIHPGAKIGERLFIDHGMGIVIGETAIVGDDVTLYHDVTLGGIAPAIDSAAQVDRKRHPTVEDGVIIGAGAQVLGDIRIGRKARIGANAVVVKDVPAGSLAIGIPARIVMPREAGGEFAAYGIPTHDLPDPVARALEAMLDQVSRLQARVASLESELQRAGAARGAGISESPSVESRGGLS